MNRPNKRPGSIGRDKRLIAVASLSAILLLSVFLTQIGGTGESQQDPGSRPAIVPSGGNPYWDVIGSMILYRNNSHAGSEPYWVAQSFELTKPAPTSVIVGLVIYVWLARDVSPAPLFPGTLDNVTVLLTNTTVDGKPNIDNPILNQTIGPQNISAAGPYPRGLMETNNSLAVRLSFAAPNPLVGFVEGQYFIFFYRTNLGDNDDYHIGYAYYWAASKLDLYYGGGSWVLDKDSEWNSYPNDMCFALVEITLP